jgi:hypothetical protein
MGERRTYPAGFDGVVVCHNEIALTEDGDAVWCMHVWMPDSSYMAHDVCSALHFKDIDGGVCAEHGGIDDIVECTDGRPFVHKVEIDRVAVENFGIEAQEIQFIVAFAFCARVADGLDGAEIVQTIYTRIVDVKRNQFRAAWSTSGRIQSFHSKISSVFGYNITCFTSAYAPHHSNRPGLVPAHAA